MTNPVPPLSEKQRQEAIREARLAVASGFSLAFTNVLVAAALLEAQQEIGQLEDRLERCHEV